MTWGVVLGYLPCISPCWPLLAIRDVYHLARSLEARLKRDDSERLKNSEVTGTEILFLSATANVRSPKDVACVAACNPSRATRAATVITCVVIR
jgi:hypothetical protein